MTFLPASIAGDVPIGEITQFLGTSVRRSFLARARLGESEIDIALLGERQIGG